LKEIVAISTATRRTGIAFQRCLNADCAADFGVDETHFECPQCGDLLDVCYDWNLASPPKTLVEFERKWSARHEPLALSGVWRFHELLPFARPQDVVSIGEGQTILQRADTVGRYVGLNSARLFLQYEGMNPSGSFKDNGMTAAFTHARLVHATRAACASTGNTSASLAIFCSAAGLPKPIVFVGSGKIAYGKLAQALDYGALTIQIVGDFDDAMTRVQQAAKQIGLYLANSLNPFRLEGQKTIIYRILEAFRWEVPDWIVVPGGNLGNSSAFGKAIAELLELGLIRRPPRLAIINAEGANNLFELVEKRGLTWQHGRPDMSIADKYYKELDGIGRKASTIASAIEINRPVNLKKALRALAVCDGIVRDVTDQEILDAKAQVGAGGLGCEPASAASVAGARLLRAQGVVRPDERVVCILTGHMLKDPTATVAYHGTDQKQFDEVLGKRGVRRASFANRPVVVPNNLDEIIRAIELYGSNS
jgi:threonine synthase